MILFIKFNAKYFFICFFGGFEPANKKLLNPQCVHLLAWETRGEAMMATMHKESVCKFSAVP